MQLLEEPLELLDTRRDLRECNGLLKLSTVAWLSATVSLAS